MIGRRCKASNGFSRPVLIARDLLSKPRLQPRYLSQVTYCGGYSGEDPPLPIPNREVKLTSADGTAPPGGRVGSCRFSEVPIEVTFSRDFFFCARGGACPKSTPSVSSTPARMAQKADCTLRSGLFGQPGGGLLPVQRSYEMMDCTPYRRRGFLVPNISSVPKAPVFCTERL